MRKIEVVKYPGPPGAGTYQFVGDFDFRDPTKPDERLGKVPKFCFGMKPVVRAKNLDVPGVGDNEVDQAPMWMKSVAYWIGTDLRRDLAVPYSHLYPGPGSYEVQQDIGGAMISFPHEEKKTTIEKTYAPGPASYVNYGTVGQAHGYLKEERNARITSVAAKKME